MIEIDGAQHSGSGTIVRVALALAAATGQPLALRRARAKRPKPGLRPQHLAAARATCELSGGRLEGARVGAEALRFWPGARIRGGTYGWDIGSAGSATMLAFGILPVACLADGPVVARITGGIFQDFAPSPHHLAEVLFPLLRQMGARATLTVSRAGYVPQGEGELELRVEPAARPLAPLHQDDPGRVQSVVGISFASHLAERQVSERMASACEQALAAEGIASMIARVDDERAAQPGASLAVWAESSTGCRFGADRAGAPRRRAETIGRLVARRLVEDVRSGGTTDRHLADQLVPFAALAEGTTRYRPPRTTPHLETNLWLARTFGARTRMSDGRVDVSGIGV